MFNIANRTAFAWRSVQRAAAGMATAARIGDTKVPMSLLEPGWYINYQRIADNLAIVRDRWAIVGWPSFVFLLLTCPFPPD